MTPRHLAIAAATVLTAAACSDSNSPTSDCPKPVTVTVSAGTKPEFSWTPACRAYQVGVFSDADGSTYWLIGFSPGNPAKTNAIASPVTYGDTLVVGDSLGPIPAKPLVAGQSYTVRVVALDAVGKPVPPIGEKHFTP
jgi:hypothetical protein